MPSKFLLSSISLALFLTVATVLTFISYRPSNVATALQKEAQFICIAKIRRNRSISDGYNLSRQTTKLLLVEQHVIKLLSLTNFTNCTALTPNGSKTLNEVFSLLGCYAAYFSSLILENWIECPETSVNNYQHTLRNNSAERRHRLHRSGSLVPRIPE